MSLSAGNLQCPIQTKFAAQPTAGAKQVVKGRRSVGRPWLQSTRGTDSCTRLATGAGVCKGDSAVEMLPYPAFQLPRYAVSGPLQQFSSDRQPFPGVLDAPVSRLNSGGEQDCRALEQGSTKGPEEAPAVH